MKYAGRQKKGELVFKHGECATVLRLTSQLGDKLTVSVVGVDANGEEHVQELGLVPHAELRDWIEEI